MACQVRDDGAERREPNARGHAVEQPASELALEPCDHAREGGLRDTKLVGGGEDGARLRNGKELDQIVTLLEHLWSASFAT